MSVEDTLRDSLAEALALPGRIDPDPQAGARIRSAAHRVRRTRLLITLLSVAAMAAIVAGIVVLIVGGPGKHRQAVAPPTPAPVTSSTGGGSASPHPSAVTSTAPATPPPAATVTVVLGGARLTLPAGWVAEPIGPVGGSTIMPTWCLMPQAGPVPAMPDAATCTISFASVLARPVVPAPLSVDTPGGLVSNPEFCGPGRATTSVLSAYQDGHLGDRPADYRQWLFVCKDGTRWPIEQYVADNAPGYILYSSHAEASVHSVLTNIAATAQLPAITAPVRLSDLGYIRTLSTGTVSYRITLDRVVRGSRGLINNNPATYTYVIPTHLFNPKRVPKVGDLVELGTDGTTVTYFSIDDF